MFRSGLTQPDLKLVRCLVVRVVFTLLVLLMLAPAVNASVRVAFINPDSQGNPFWDVVTDNMQAAAQDLDMDLEVLYAERDRFASFDIVQALLTGFAPPEYLVYIYQAGTARKILDLAERRGVKSFIINTEVHPQEIHRVGKPRQRYRHWIGHIYPDDEAAGRDLAQYLIKRAQAEQESGQIEVVGLSGTQDSSAALERNKGLAQAVAMHDGKLNQLVYAQWSGKIAAQKLSVLVNRYPNTQVVWAASDVMAIASAQLLAEKKTRRPMLVGGIDWTIDGLKAVKAGLIDASVGGHFSEGAWALVMIHDYHRGLDFADQGVTIKSKMQLLHKGNVQEYLDKVLGVDFKAVDFARFSNFYHPELDHYDFSLNALLDAVSIENNN